MKMNLQKFAGKTTNVFPVSANQFKLGADKESATTVADLETFSPSFSNGGRNLDSNGYRRMAESINDSQSPYYYA